MRAKSSKQRCPALCILAGTVNGYGFVTLSNCTLMNIDIDCASFAATKLRFVSHNKKFDVSFFNYSIRYSCVIHF